MYGVLDMPSYRGARNDDLSHHTGVAGVTLNVDHGPTYLVGSSFYRL